MNENTAVETSAIAESEEIDTEIEVEPKHNLLWYTNSSSVVKSTNDTLNGHKFVETIHKVYDKTVQWKKILLKLPSGNASKIFIRELTS